MLQCQHATLGLFQAKSPNVVSPKEHRWQVNYFGYVPNFCKVTSWGAWQQKCPCNKQFRTRQVISSADSKCRTPPLDQKSKPCKCAAALGGGSTAATAQATKAAASPTPSPTSPPTPAPTKAALADVTTVVTITSETKASFNAAKQLQFRTQLAAIISAGLYEDLTIDDVRDKTVGKTVNVVASNQSVALNNEVFDIHHNEG